MKYLSVAIFLTIIAATAQACLNTLIPMEGADLNHPDSSHGDLNLALRGYTAVGATPALIDLAGSTDGGAPRFPGMFAGGRTPGIVATYQAYGWDWGCGEHGCRGDPVTGVEVGLLGLATSPGETIGIPSKSTEIYGGGYVAVVLYAEPTRLVVAYTRDGTVANGYSVHIEQFCVDPNLLARYREGNVGERRELPGLLSGQAVGTAAGTETIVAIRDRGRFMDPRSRKDWW